MYVVVCSEQCVYVVVCSELCVCMLLYAVSSVCMLLYAVSCVCMLLYVACVCFKNYVIIYILIVHYFYCGRKGGYHCMCLSSVSIIMVSGEILNF